MGRVAFALAASARKADVALSATALAARSARTTSAPHAARIRIAEWVASAFQELAKKVIVEQQPIAAEVRSARAMFVRLA